MHACTHGCIRTYMRAYVRICAHASIRTPHACMHAQVRGDDVVNEAVCQVAFADRILLNKIDLVSKEALHDLKETIHSING